MRIVFRKTNIGLSDWKFYALNVFRVILFDLKRSANISRWNGIRLLGKRLMMAGTYHYENWNEHSDKFSSEIPCSFIFVCNKFENSKLVYHGWKVIFHLGLGAKNEIPLATENGSIPYDHIGTDLTQPMPFFSVILHHPRPNSYFEDKNWTSYNIISSAQKMIVEWSKHFNFHKNTRNYSLDLNPFSFKKSILMVWESRSVFIWLWRYCIY